jgi:hypothetical protein
MAGMFECSFSDKSCFPEVEFLVLFVLVLFAMCLRADRMAQLLDERDLGVLTSSMSLLVALVSNNHEAYWSCLPKCVKTLERLARNQDVPQEYTYYGIPSPWLQVCVLFSSCFVCNGCLINAQFSQHFAKTVFFAR